MQQRNFDSAMEFANRAVRCSPDFAMTYYTRAHVLEASGCYRDSIEDYKKVVSLGHELSLADQGRVYEKLGLIDNAASCYCEAFRINHAGLDHSTLMRGVAAQRALQPGEYDVGLHPNAVRSLLGFFNDAIEREPTNKGLQECLKTILQNGP